MDTISRFSNDFVFPQNPTIGQAVQGPTGAVWWWDGTKWIGGVGPDIQVFLPISGGTMTGPLYLAEDPILPDEAVTKNYVDDIALKAIPEAPFTGQAFGRMLGTWTPVLPIVGGAMRGNIIMTSPFTVTNLPQPRNGTDAVPLNYIQDLLTTGLQFMGTWQVASNIPDLSLNTASFENGDYWLATTVDPNTPELVPPQVPGIGGTLVENGSMVVWNTAQQEFNVVANTGLTMVQADARYLQLGGGTMTGMITLSGDAQLPLNPVSYQQMQALVALYLPLAGGTMTGGGITMAAGYQPFGPQDVATKSYVDTGLADYTPVYVGISPPVNPANGDLWWDAVSGNLFIWYVDANSAQWVVANDTDPGPIGPQGPQGPQGAEGPPGPVYTFQGTVPTAADLPATGNIGDAYITSDTGSLWIWNGSEWSDAGNITGPPGPQGPEGPQGPPFSPPTTGTGGIFVLNTSPTINAPTVIQGMTVDTLTVGSPSTSSPAPLVVGGQGITYSSVGAGGANIAFITSAGSIYCFQNGVNFGGSLITSTGGTMTGALVLSGNATANLNPVPLQQLNSILGGYVTQTGHTFQLSWDGTFVNVHVDGTATPGQIANVSWVNANFLPLTGGNINGSIAANGYIEAPQIGVNSTFYMNSTNVGYPVVNFQAGTWFGFNAGQGQYWFVINGANEAWLDGNGNFQANGYIRANQIGPSGGANAFNIYYQNLGAGVQPVINFAAGYYETVSPGGEYSWQGSPTGTLMTLDWAGNLWAIAWTSDSRVKADIEPASDGLAVVLQLAPKRYHRIYDLTGHEDFVVPEELGFVADEVQAVAPIAVVKTTLGPDKDLLAIKNDAMIALLVNAVKELNAKVEALSAR